jgi:hypothetical protein
MLGTMQRVFAGAFAEYADLPNGAFYIAMLEFFTVKCTLNQHKISALYNWRVFKIYKK